MALGVLHLLGEPQIREQLRLGYCEGLAGLEVLSVAGKSLPARDSFLCT